MCNAGGKCSKVIVDSGSMDNLVSQEMVEKLSFKRSKHPSPYKVSWLQKEHMMTMSEQCLVKFHIGSYKDKVLCDMMPMTVCHVLLGRPLQFDMEAIYDGRRNVYTIQKYGKEVYVELSKGEGKATERIQHYYLL